MKYFIVRQDPGTTTHGSAAYDIMIHDVVDVNVKERTVVKREDVIDCYRYLLDRLPENDEVIDAKCAAASLEDVVADVVASVEFLECHKAAIARHLMGTSRSNRTS